MTCYATKPDTLDPAPSHRNPPLQHPTSTDHRGNRKAQWQAYWIGGLIKKRFAQVLRMKMQLTSSSNGDTASTKDMSHLESGPLSTAKDAPDVAIGHVSDPVSPVDTVAERQLVRKFDILVMVMIFFMYFFNSIDRSNLGNAKTDHMDKDLGFVGNQYSILIMVFYVPFCGLCLPANLVTRKFQPKWFLVGFMLCWGAMAMVCAACKDFAQVSCSCKASHYCLAQSLVSLTDLHSRSWQ